MKKFIIKSLPYLLIGIVYALIGEFYLIKFHEITPLKKVTEIQSNSSKQLYFSRKLFANNLSLYKYEMFKQVEPKVLVLGQSVTLHFRDFMFKPYESFYNTGLMIRNRKDLNLVLDQIDNEELAKPELIVLGLDFTFFLDTNKLEHRTWSEKDAVFKSKSHLRAIQSIFLGGKIRNIPEKEYGFGRYGIVGRGYRNDGSFRCKPEIEQYLKDSSNYDSRFREKLENGLHPFLEPFRFSEIKARKMKQLLTRYKQSGISLVIYVPPFTDSFFDLAMKDDRFVKFWQQYLKFEQELVKEDFNVIPFTTPSKIGLDDDYMIDADHPSEVLCAIQLRDFLTKYEAGDNKLKRINIKNLSDKINDDRTIPKSFLLDSINYQKIH